MSDELSLLVFTLHSSLLNARRTAGATTGHQLLQVGRAGCPSDSQSPTEGDPPAALSHQIPTEGNPHQVLAPQRTGSGTSLRKHVASAQPHPPSGSS
ncbi:hypothetical protein HW132_19405 [Brasilonema sp. CT11]|nr:hypothetical protein [Brasilonema sp. CT11]